MAIAITSNQSRKDLIANICEIFNDVSAPSLTFVQKSDESIKLVDFMFTELKPKYKAPVTQTISSQPPQQATNLLDEFGLSNHEVVEEAPAPRKVSNTLAKEQPQMNGSKVLVQKAMQEASNPQPLQRKFITLDRESGDVNVTSTLVTLPPQTSGGNNGEVRDIESRLKKRSAALAGRDLDSLIKEQREEEK